MHPRPSGVMDTSACSMKIAEQLQLRATLTFRTKQRRSARQPQLYRLPFSFINVAPCSGPYSRPDDRERTEIITALTPSHSMSPFNLRHPFPFLTFGRDDQHKPQRCGTRTSLVPSHSCSQTFFLHSFDFFLFSYVRRSVDACIRSWFSLTQALSRGILYISYPRLSMKGIIGSKSSVLISLPTLSCFLDSSSFVRHSRPRTRNRCMRRPCQPRSLARTPLEFEKLSWS